MFFLLLISVLQHLASRKLSTIQTAVKWFSRYVSIKHLKMSFAIQFSFNKSKIDIYVFEIGLFKRVILEMKTYNIFAIC